MTEQVTVRMTSPARRYGNGCWPGPGGPPVPDFGVAGIEALSSTITVQSPARGGTALLVELPIATEDC
jgi:hypothetical protein